MKKYQQLAPRVFCYVILVFTGTALFSQPIIHHLSGHKPQVVQYQKLELIIVLTAQFSNPYDYDQVHPKGWFISPDNDTIGVDGFFMLDYTLNENSGGLTPSGNGSFRLRFAPGTPGAWRYWVTIKDRQGETKSQVQEFVTTASQDLNGYLKKLNNRYIGFDNSELFLAVGENVGWHQSNPYLDYRKWLGDLKQNQGNFYRLWQCHWGLGLEWRPGNGYAGLRNYHQANAFYLDRLFEFSEQQGLYVMWALQHHGQVSTQVNPNWSESPYNQSNGGPCVNTWDFFTDASAQAHTRNRYRYAVARWGHQCCIAAWELFNEVDLTDQFENRKGDVAAWHIRMADFIRSIDPYQHLISTSYAQDHFDPALWQDASMDFTQTHYYLGISNLERTLARGVKTYAQEYHKPTINGEFGITTSGVDLTTTDRQGIHVHNSLWASLFAGAFGAGMTWWWDSYIAPNNLYYHFDGLGRLAPELIEADFTPADVFIQGAAGDLVINPSLGWAGLGDTLIRITSNGQVIPADARLGQYLYGSIWNTQFRRPPTFELDLRESIQMTVQTGGETGQASRIAFWLDGVKVLDQTGQTNQKYTLTIPAGKHRLLVDNTGTDWITIRNYTFTKLGSQVDAYVLKNEARTKASGWILNTLYNHDYLRTQGMPPAVRNAHLILEGLKAGTYTLEWFNTLTGVSISSQSVTTSSDTLIISIPDLRWDLAFALNESTVSIKNLRQNLDFRVFPNPAHHHITLQWPEPLSEPLEFTLVDVLGRILLKKNLPGPSQQDIITLPQTLTAGYYWCFLKTNHRAGQALVWIER